MLAEQSLLFLVHHLAEDAQTKRITSGPSRPHISSENVRTLPSGLVQQGALAQLGERLICIQEVRSSILLGSTITNLSAKQCRLLSRPIGRF